MSEDLGYLTEGMQQNDKQVLKNLSQMGEQMIKLRTNMLTKEAEYEAAKMEYEHFANVILPQEMFSVGLTSITLAKNEISGFGVLGELPAPGEMTNYVPAIVLNSDQIRSIDLSASRLIAFPAKMSGDEEKWATFVSAWEFGNTMPSALPAYDESESLPEWATQQSSTIWTSCSANVNKAVVMAGQCQIALIAPAFKFETLYLCKKYPGCACTFAGAVYEGCNFKDTGQISSTSMNHNWCLACAYANGCPNNPNNSSFKLNGSKISAAYDCLKHIPDREYAKYVSVQNAISNAFSAFCTNKFNNPTTTDRNNIRTMINAGIENGKLKITSKSIGIHLGVNGNNRFPWIDFHNPEYAYIPVKHENDPVINRGIYSQAFIQLDVK